MTIARTPVRRRGARAVALAAATVWLFAPAVIGAQQTGLTIYNDGRVLVRRTLSTPVPKGTSEQRLALGSLDPATLFALDSGVTITSVYYDGGTDEASAMRRALGRTIVFRIGKDTTTATVVGVDPERFRLADGRIVFLRPGQASLPEDLVVLDPVAKVTLKSEAALKELRVGYFTDGADWEASYEAVLGRGSARVTGSAVVGSRTLRVKDAELQLLAGAVSRAAAAPPVRPMAARAGMLKVAAAAAEEATEERVGEFHLYTLAGRSSLEPGATTSVALFEPASVPFERAYVVRGQLPYYGYIPQQGDETDTPVEVTYTLKRPRKTDFGERPIPGGVARLFQPDSAGRLQLIGEATVRHTPPGEDLRVAAGTAFDLTARRVQTAYSTRRDTTKAAPGRTIATADYTVTLANATDSAVTIEVREERAGEWSVLSSSVPAEKVSSTVTRFRVAVPGRGRAVLTYRIRAVW
ncbi:MAG TPA: hypothetical protein VK688_10855 [Gemmatimonadales bacterium]|nr:hypothetical protein [Gemmatimonadales bacterium]